MDRIYFPQSNEIGWNEEVSSIVGWLDGIGLDVGCGGRSIKPSDFTLDLDPECEPDVLASGDAIPFPDNSFDYVYGIHSLEHLEDPKKGIFEWLRVTKKGGIVALIHPDVDYTGIQKTGPENVQLHNKPLYRHHREINQKDFLRWITPFQRHGFKIIESGDAWRAWSFYIILRKI